MSGPRRTPLSRHKTSLSPTADRIAGSTSIGAGAASSWRPPWFEMTMPSTPCSTASRASATDWIPLISKGFFHALRIPSIIAQLTDPVSWDEM